MLSTSFSLASLTLEAFTMNDDVDELDTKDILAFKLKPLSGFCRLF